VSNIYKLDLISPISTIQRSYKKNGKAEFVINEKNEVSFLEVSQENLHNSGVLTGKESYRRWT
jgi:hypothetical protein